MISNVLVDLFLKEQSLLKDLAEQVQLVLGTNFQKNKFKLADLNSLLLEKFNNATHSSSEMTPIKAPEKSNEIQLCSKFQDKPKKKKT